VIFTNKEIIIKSVLEFGRIIVIAIIPVLISSLEKGMIDWKSIAVAGVIAGLKAIDKLLHEYGVEKEEETGEPSEFITGLVRF
jgi:hypothetical protein